MTEQDVDGDGMTGSPGPVSQFLLDIFGTLDGVWVAAVDKSGSGWGGGFAGAMLPKLAKSPDCGHYYSVAKIKAGSTTRDHNSFEAAYAFVIDDVGFCPGGKPNALTGSKIDKDFVDQWAPKPSYVIETSPGNYQYVYALKTPETDVDRFAAIRKKFRASKHWGGGGEGTEAFHYFRLPSGASIKAARLGFKTAFGPAGSYDRKAKFTLDTLMDTFGVKISKTDIAAEALAAAAAAAPPTGSVGDIKEVEALLRSIPNDKGAFGYDEWAGIGLIVKGASGGDDHIRDVWIDWSNQFPGPQTEDPAKKWDNDFNGSREGIEALRTKARRWGDPDKPGEVASIIFAFEADPIDQTRVDDIGKNVLGRGTQTYQDALIALREAQDEPGQKITFQAGGFMPGKRVMPLRMRDVSPWHSRATVTTMAATGGTGKTSWVIMLALAMAYERPDIMGLSTPFDWLGDIVMVLNEDRHSVHALVAAAEKEHGLDPNKQIHGIHLYPKRLGLVKVAFNEITPSAEATKFVMWLAKIRAKTSIALLVLDHFGSVSGGAKENSAEETGAVMGMLADIAEAGFLGVSLTHHNSKDGEKYRGSTAIYDNSRSFLALKVEDPATPNHLTLAHTKANARRPDVPRYYLRTGCFIDVLDPRPPSSTVSQEFPVLTHTTAAPPAVVKRQGGTVAAAMSPLLGEALDALRDALAGGEEVRDVRGGMQSAKDGSWRAAARVVEVEVPCSAREARDMVDVLLRDKRIVRVDGVDRKGNKVYRVEMGMDADAPF